MSMLSKAFSGSSAKALALGATGLAPLPLLGSVFGGAGQSYLDYQGAKEAREADISSAREQMGFQKEMVGQQRDYETEMSNTAHQREVGDLKAAGLNPVLSANSGASTPVISAPSGQNIDAENLMPDIQGRSVANLNSALSLASTLKGIQESDSRIKLNKANQRNTETDTTAKEIGLTSKFVGTKNWLTDLFDSFKSSAKEGMRQANEWYIGKNKLKINKKY